jgi:hypothetical protein
MGISTLEAKSLARLEEALRRRVCSVCIDRNVDGTCNLNARHECALFERFPEIASALLRVQSDTIDDYIAVIREVVCDNCPNQEESGFCRVREEVRCALDRYLLLIVNVVEEGRAPILKGGRPLVKLLAPGGSSAMRS